MKKSNIPFLTFLALSLWIFPFCIVAFLGDFFASIVPGWNTTILYQWPAALVKSIVLIFVGIGYWKLKKGRNDISSKFFLFHVIFTIPSLVFLKFFLFQFVDPNAEPEEFLDTMEFISTINMILSLIFFMAQIAFVFYYFRLKKQATANSR